MRLIIYVLIFLIVFMILRMFRRIRESGSAGKVNKKSNSRYKNVEEADFREIESDTKKKDQQE